MQLDLLPPELILKIFIHLDYRSLVLAREVCTLFCSLVDDHATLQYKIELACANMQDGPPSNLTAADRLSLLKRHQSAWNTLQWTSSQEVSMNTGRVWELYGGVLAQSRDPSNLSFRTLPSQLRGVEEQTWNITFEHTIIRDFAMDPSQDLLVFLEPPERIFMNPDVGVEIRTRIRLRSLSTGGCHPAGPDTGLLIHSTCTPEITRMSFSIMIHADYVAIHYMSNVESNPELEVWNWKTGESVMCVHGDRIRTASFLGEHYMLVGGWAPGASQCSLYVLDLHKVSGTHLLEETSYTCEFLFPQFDHWTSQLAFSIRADPAPSWQPDQAKSVPFHIASQSRLYVIITLVRTPERIFSYDLFVLSDTFLRLIAQLGHDEERRQFSWEEWGPHGTRLVPSLPHSSVWVCFVYGTKFATIFQSDGLPEHPSVIEIWDFNSVGIRKGHLAGEHSLEDEDNKQDKTWNVQWHKGDTSIVSDGAFVGDVRTRLPYRIVRRTLPSSTLEDGDDPEDSYHDLMCSEDNLILVDATRRQFRILSF
ncbi:hypothetical protein CONPUDRAFT_115643 [Coniophora puteana RWD-64-598 SS2]|uniref:F-box domain-containing protein n=1 Tax=Coniophora puteana (strain RWD-64-598) TaxID=741705 RepID=A0A5M3N608_CONPW|nr:uncharacterized protein CONPUDRAFT_115643 [Coniophora puteana RWD-64-598 SS2]EIW86862.1 hypothetical protein CONPUDRAFT_115643 [Coniophora puteana RWD-64-598 SS2]